MSRSADIYVLFQMSEKIGKNRNKKEDFEKIGKSREKIGSGPVIYIYIYIYIYTSFYLTPFTLYLHLHVYWFDYYK